MNGSALGVGLLLAGLVAGVHGCGDPGSRDAASSGAEPARRASGRPAPAGPPDASPSDTLAACREVLIRYAGAIGAPDSVTRSREAAERLVAEVAERARSGVDFDILVSTRSEGHTGDRNGFIAPFSRGTRPRSFEDAVFPLEVGEIAGPIESPYGFHVVIRERGESFTAAQIVIAYEGAQGATGESASRSRSEAIALVARLRARVIDDPDSFGAVAREYTDGPRKQMGGNLGTFNLYTYGRFFGEVVAGLRPGEISEVFETRQGFNIVKRTR